MHTYHNDFELFGYALLTYLIVLSDNNLIDDYSLDSLAEVAPFSGTLSLLDVHFMINYPRLNVPVKRLLLSLVEVKTNCPV